MRVAIICQARMTSTRLPGKVLLPVLGRPLLAYQLERLQRVRNADTLVVATTSNASDDAIVALCQQLGVATWRGSEHDVLARYADAAAAQHADVVVRVTSDCPLLDPAVVEQAIVAYRAGDCDYVSNSLQRTFPRGMDVEVFSAAALARAQAEASTPAEREHVTPYIYHHPDCFRLKTLCYPQDQSQHRWTVDTPEDFALIERLLTALYPAQPLFTLEDALALIAQHPEWSALNAHVEQKSS